MPGPPARLRHNAKARASAPGASRKKGKQKSARPAADVGDPNAAVIVPKSQETKENERKEKLRVELVQASDSKMNAKKKRRLDKYIDKKLAKEERILIFEKLAQSQNSSTAAKLQPSSTLGSGRPTTHEERVAWEEDRETRRALAGLPPSTSRSRKRKRGRVPDMGGVASEEDSAFESDPTSLAADDDPPLTPRKVIEVLDSSLQGPSTSSLPEVGSALQRNADGTIVQPKIVKRKPKANKRWKMPKEEIRIPDTYEDISSDSFDSSDSAYDSSSGSSGAAEEEVWTGFAGDDTNEEPTEVDPQDESGGDTDDSSEKSRDRRNKTGFKDWALKQLASAKGYESTLSETLQSDSAPLVTAPSISQLPKTSQKSYDPIKGPLGEVLSLPSSTFAQHVRAQGPTLDSKNMLTKKNVAVERPDDVQASRLLLPIVAEEQPITEAILLNPVVVICGETGSGKTTQVPQFLYEAGFGSPGSDNPGMIGITQPRRVAAMSMASRVAAELSLPSSRVSYQIRYDATVSPTTTIKFMTDGVLLRELAADLLLSRYSVVIVDEAHERSMNTDILIGVLSRVVRLRESMWREGKEGVKPLRLIIMSATLRITDFTANTTLFSTPPPVINIAARQHPVTVHFNRRTVSDYVTEAVRKTVKIHARLPPGGVLVFLTGQNEIRSVCKKLEARFGRKAIREKKMRRQNRSDHVPGKMNAGAESREHVQPAVVPTQVDIEAEDMDLGADVNDHLAMDVDGDVGVTTQPDALDSDPETPDEDSVLIDTDDSEVPLHIVPLYSLLSSDKQMEVFRPPPLDARLVVVSTNVAETSLTIPGIRYVVDCGRAKERKYDAQSGIQSFQVAWISKASAAQRAGRAGRTGPGHCYRLYSSALFEHHFDNFAQPEILRVPIEGVVLQMKSMNIDTVVNFPFPTPPDRTSLKRAETILRHLGSLGGTPEASQITELGRSMALFPVSPRFSKMLVAGRQHGCLPYVIAIVSALSVGDPFLREEALTGNEKDLEGETSKEEETAMFPHIRSTELREKEVAKARRRAFFATQQTHGSLGQQTSDVFRMLSVVGAYEYAGGGQEFCAAQFVRPKAMEEIHKLRSQITQIVQANFPDIVEKLVPKVQPPSDMQLKILRQLLTAGFVDQVAVRKDVVDKASASGNKYASCRGVPYNALGISEDVFIHPSSVLFHATPPEYVIFHEIVRTSRPWIKTLTIINPAWLPKLAPTLCTISKPLKSSGNSAVVVPRYGPTLWELPPVKE